MAIMSTPIDLSKPGRPLRVGVILCNSKTEILDVAPVDIFSALSTEYVDTFPPGMISDKMRKEALEVEFHWVNESGETADLTGGIKLQPTHTFANCPTLDICLMGAHSPTYVLTPGEVAFINKSYTSCAAFLTICGGALAALQAGLFEGKTVTAPRPMVEMLKQSNPEVKWTTKRWQRDGKLWTSGALLNGLDMMAAFVTEYWGKEDPSTYAEFGLRLGAYPRRDVEYADVEWDL